MIVRLKYYTESDYAVSIGEDDVLTRVYCDSYGNFFVMPDTNTLTVVHICPKMRFKMQHVTADADLIT